MDDIKELVERLRDMADDCTTSPRVMRKAADALEAQAADIEAQDRTIGAFAKATKGVALSRVRKLAQADREGRVVVLPCKMGDTIYKIPSETNHALNKISGHADNNRVYEQKVCRAEVYENGVFCFVTCDGMDSVHSAFYMVDWFLTREEAEKALEAMNNADR